MRRLDWFLAAVVVSFLLGVVTVETTGSLISHFGFGHLHGFSAGDVSVRRLVSHLPGVPILPGDAR